MTEHKVDLRNLVKEAGSEIIISYEQIDENGNIVREPVLIFATGGERLGCSVFYSVGCGLHIY